MLGLQQGNAVLKEIHKEMNPESVERLLEETAEAQAYQRVSNELAYLLHIPERQVTDVKVFPSVNSTGNRRDACNPNDSGRGRCSTVRARSSRARSRDPSRRATKGGHIAERTANRACLTGAGTRNKARTSTSKGARGRETSCSCMSTHRTITFDLILASVFVCNGIHLCCGALCSCCTSKISDAVWKCVKRPSQKALKASDRPQNPPESPCREQSEWPKAKPSHKQRLMFCS